ncbi:MAG TPA: HDOD domain-containing protein [Tepidisphaeraceae bacterium]|jgi:putative nucleotidyltransferase with HDIG domain|nr:HDOD domain-containing protein [Tepidisphaeraceae bacterium]
MAAWIVLIAATLLLSGTVAVIWRSNRKAADDSFAQVDAQWDERVGTDLTSPAVTPALFAAPPEGAKIRPADVNELQKSQLLDEVVSGLEKIPPLPRAVHNILRELNSMGSTARSVASIVGTEPILVASILRMVNSAAFGLRREILSLEEAVAYLGFSTVKALVVRLKLGPMMGIASADAKRTKGYHPEKLWLHSMAVAQTSEHLAKRVGGVDPWLAGTIGLLHDIGKLAINSTFPQIVGQIWDKHDGDESFLARERRLFGADHAFIGGFLAAKWELPGDLVEAIRLHHMPAGDSAVLAMPSEMFRAVSIVHVANQLVKYSHVYCADMEIDIVPSAVLTELGLSPDLERLLDRDTQAIIERSVQLMREPMAQQRNARYRKAG